MPGLPEPVWAGGGGTGMGLRFYGVEMRFTNSTDRSPGGGPWFLRPEISRQASLIQALSFSPGKRKMRKKRLGMT